MNFKTSIAAVALTVATSGFSLVGPVGEHKTICLSSYTDANGVQYAGSCDEAANNKELGLALQANGCAEGQVAVGAYSFGGGQFNVQVANCMPPNVVQL